MHIRYDSCPSVSIDYSDSKYLDNCEVLATSYEDILSIFKILEIILAVCVGVEPTKGKTFRSI